MQRFVSLLAVGTLATAAMAQFTTVIPAGMAAAEGSTSNAFPWGRGGTGLLHQCVYDSSHFTTQGINFPILITGLKWRPNTNVALVASSYTAGCTVSLSTCPLDQNSVSTTMASNRGADFATCFNGVVSWNAQPAQVGPTPFGISIPLQTNFLYDPNLGDLNIECDLPIQTFTGTGPQLDVHGVAGQALASRIYISTGYPGTGTGVIGLNHAVVVEVEYVPASGLYAGFSANVTTGASPLAVNFTDGSFSSAPGGVVTWAWDFDGDSVIDSNLQNPSFVYNGCGNFNVTLTVNDGVHPPSTLTKTGYIVTDQLTANFTDTVIGPLVVQFNDTSNMPATAWAWDLDGDSIIDSNVQNPAFAYPNANPVAVTLTATRNCKSSTVTRTIVPSQQLTTNLAANNGGASLWTIYYDLTVSNPKGVNITSFDSISSTVNTPFTVDVYLKLGPYSGSEYTAAPWTKVGTAAGTSNAVANQPSNAAFPLALHIPAGTYGVAMRYIGITPRYVTQTSIQVVSNSDLSMSLGSSAATTVGPFQGTTTTVNSPRMWSGTLYYGTHNVTGQAGHGWFAPGCAGTLGVTHQTTVSHPTLGGTLSVSLDNMPFALGVMVVGFSNTVSGFGPLPVDLGFIGAPGCPLRVSLDATDTILGAGTTATWNFAIPAVPALSGALLYNQPAVFDPAANAFGFVTGDAAGWVLGT
jgi:PKD repeat protein